MVLSILVKNAFLFTFPLVRMMIVVFFVFLWLLWVFFSAYTGVDGMEFAKMLYLCFVVLVFRGILYSLGSLLAKKIECIIVLSG